MLGEWGSIGYGILIMAVGASILKFVLAPGLLSSMPAVAFYEKGNKLAGFFIGFLGQLYTIAIFTVW
jgi:hypothetical protein